MAVEQTKAKPLLPVLKEKKRYLVYEVRSSSLQTFHAYNLIVKLKELLGIYDGARAGIQHITYEPETHRGIIRVSAALADKTRGALLLINNIQKTRVAIDPIIISGILKKAKQHIQHNATMH